jgi:hypothetical protein
MHLQQAFLLAVHVLQVCPEFRSGLQLATLDKLAAEKPCKCNEPAR